jgi:hypothetical protein
VWYAIIGGAGLALGIGFMIWALRERKLRYEATAAAAKAMVALADQRKLARDNAEKAQNLEFNCTKLNEIIVAQRNALSEAHNRLVQCEDPTTIKGWLDDVLKGGSL